jgi:arylsulfatase
MAKKNPATARKKTQPVQPPSDIERSLAQLRIKLHGLASFALIPAVAWLALVTVELAVHIFMPESPLRNAQLPIGARLFLLCYSLMISFLCVVAIIGLFTLLKWIHNRFFAPYKSIRWINSGLTASLTWLVLLVYSSSWGLFWQTGSFIDGQAFLFIAPHPLQVFHWVDVDVALIVVALALVSTWVLLSWLPRWVKRRAEIAQRRFVSVCGWMIGICLLGSALGEIYSNADGRQFMRTTILYAKSRADALGPFPHIFGDIQRYIRRQPEERFKADDIRIIQRPILSMDRYLATAAPRSVDRRNVIILIIESLRPDQLRAYGSGRDVMPNIDALANVSRVFSNTYTHSSHTNYATITPLSSHYPLRSSTSYTYPENPSYPRVLIYDVLKALGYRTAIFSSSNENWGGMINYLNTGNLDRFIHAANSKKPTFLMHGDAGFAAWARETKHAGSLDDRSTVDEAIEWIDSLDDKAFFVAMNFQNSHLPYPVPPDFPRRFGPAKLDFTIRFAHFPKDKVQEVKDVYADSLAYVDSQIGRLFQYLRDKNKWGNTLIVVTGDHGQAFYEHGFASHASAIFDEVMRVPLIIRAPGLKAGLDSRLAQHVDIAPSIVGLLGLPTHPSFQGTDLLNTVAEPKRSAYMVAQTPLAYQYGIVRSGFKLIYDEREGRYSLFNLAADPDEKLDVAGSHPTLVNDLAKRLQTWRTLQIDYYADKRLQTQEYPPIIAD